MNLREEVRQPGATLVDVRTGLEVCLGAVPGAVHIPSGDVEDRWTEFREMSRPVIVFCRSGARSGNAINFLRSKGITDLINGGGADAVRAALE